MSWKYLIVDKTFISHTLFKRVFAYENDTKILHTVFAPILEAVSYKTAAVRPLTSHLTNHPSKTYWELRTNSKVIFSDRLLHMDPTVLANQQKLTVISSLQTLDTVKRTCQEQWLIGTDSKRESRESLLSAHLDEDETQYQVTYLQNSYLFKNEFIDFNGMSTFLGLFYA